MKKALAQFGLVILVALAIGLLPSIQAQNWVFNNLSTRNGYLGETRVVTAGGATTTGLLVKTAVTGNVNTALVGDVGVFGVATSSQTAGLSVEIAEAGVISCVADNGINLNNLVGVGTVTAGRCRDLGANSSLGVSNQIQIVGKALVSATVGNLFLMQVYGPGIYGVNNTVNAIAPTNLTAAVSTATLCSTATTNGCGTAGNYKVNYTFIEAGTACGTPGTGGVTFLLTWTDTNGTAHTAVSLPMNDATSIASVSQTFHFQTSLAAAWGEGTFNIATNGAIIQYATGYTACSVGTGTYQLTANVARM